MKSFFTNYEIILSNGVKNRALSLILENQLTYKKSRISPEGLILSVNEKQKNQITSLFKKHNIRAEEKEILGYFSLLCPLKRRWGLFIGALFLFVALLFSQRIVWRIDITGNTKTCKADILKELEDAGLHLGTYIPGIDYDSIHNRLLLNSSTLAWVSVNKNGNVASVMVKEKEDANNNQNSVYTNVVAKYDGYIDSIILKNGKKAVKIGDVVKKGDILISGVLDSQAEGVKYEHASGEVKAYVNKEINIKIPLKSSKKIYTGNTLKCYKYKIYNFPLKFSSKYSNLSGFYDTIEKSEMMTILGVANIPIEVVTTVYYEYKIEDITHTLQEASDLAYAELTSQLENALLNAELISKSLSTSYDDDYFYLNCKIYCLEDIAEEKEFYISK